jgi:bifunctional UDP-N-acetylglucosamine pyrophosphorylase / glucosamine-1-phosphate N-acetyltransferase
MKTILVLVAAGKGTRMKSEKHKVLHEIGGKPMVLHSVDTFRSFSNEKPTIIVGYQAEEIMKVVGNQANFVMQEKQLGTGHAVLMAKDLLENQSDLIVVVFADMPMIKEESIVKLVRYQKEHQGPITLMTAVVDDPRGFGRIVRDQDGSVKSIVEEVDCTDDQLKIRELNISLYCFNAKWLWENIEKIPISKKGEYYLTDIVALANQQGLTVAGLKIDDVTEGIGINNRVHLAEAEEIIRNRINNYWMLEGVTLIDPSSTYIESEVIIGKDTIVYPNTTISGKTKIGENCQLGPNSIIFESNIGDFCEIKSSVVEQAILKNNVDVGPFAHLRKGAHLDDNVHIGNFGEIKNSYLAPDVKVGHFSYLGDATIGERVNIGAGTITCNYDGKNKNKTVIEEDVFIGSDTMLIAPLTLKKGARTGAGSVVNKNVEENTVVVGIPARAIGKTKK